MSAVSKPSSLFVHCFYLILKLLLRFVRNCMLEGLLFVVAGVDVDYWLFGQLRRLDFKVPFSL